MISELVPAEYSSSRARFSGPDSRVKCERLLVGRIRYESFA